MDGPRDKNDTDSCGGYVLVIGATTRPGALDPALRRSRRFKIALRVPDEDARAEILTVAVKRLRLESIQSI
ncbi:unnamed protein product [Brassica oleracea var. botrytis]|uniref:ATPase AAA-type core domain-containing protein n=1 Tax=Brassica carinata TaxID=52824 RepID=A0A8X7RVR6_BRACI|nr:hypothetical protein Bca52824_041606 [Brassica carinata]